VQPAWNLQYARRTYDGSESDVRVEERDASGHGNHDVGATRAAASTPVIFMLADVFTPDAAPDLSQTAVDAERYWRAYLEKDTQRGSAHAGLAHALSEQGRHDEAEAVLTAAGELLPGEVSFFLEYARLAETQGNWPEAVRRWAYIRSVWPNEWPIYTGQAAAQCELEQFDAACATLETALPLFPNESSVPYQLARLAERRQDWVAGERHWRRYVELQPTLWWAHSELARAVARQGRAEDADAVLTAARTVLPREAGVYLDYARLAEARHDWNEAARRWAEVRDNFPEAWIGYTGHANAQRELGQFDAARATLEAGNIRFPDEPSVLHDLGRLAEHRKDWGEAERCWRELRRLDPRPWWVHDALVFALRAQGRFDAAEAAQVEAFHHAVQRGDNTPETLTYAMRVLIDGPAADIATPVLRCLAHEVDSGERDWAPRIADTIDLFYRDGSTQRQLMAAYMRDSGADSVAAMDPATRVVWQAIAGLPATEEDTALVFERWLPLGRMRLVSTVFSFLACVTDPKRREAAESFEMFVDRRLSQPGWPGQETPLAVVSYLMFAVVHAPRAYHRIVAAARRHIDWHRLGHGGEALSNTVLAQILAFAADDDAATTEPELARPASIAPPRERLRIAVEVSGQLRGYTQAGATWSHLGLAGHDVTTFVSTWQDTGRNPQRLWDPLWPYQKLWHLIGGPTGQSFLQTRFPRLNDAVTRALHGVGEVDAATLRSFYGTDHVILEDDRYGQFQDKRAVWKMHYKMEQVHRLARETGQTFDLFIRMRPDYAVGARTAVDWQRLTWLSAREHGLALDIPFQFIGKGGVLKLGDAFAAGTLEPMNVFAGTFSWQEEVMRQNQAPLDSPLDLINHLSPAYAVFCQGVTARQVEGLEFRGLLNPPLIAPADVLSLLLDDIGGTPRDDLEREFVAAYRTATGGNG